MHNIGTESKLRRDRLIFCKNRRSQLKGCCPLSILHRAHCTRVYTWHRCPIEKSNTDFKSGVIAWFFCFCAAFHRNFCSVDYRNFCSVGYRNFCSEATEISVTHTTEISVPLTTEISVKSSAKADETSLSHLYLSQAMKTPINFMALHFLAKPRRD